MRYAAAKGGIIGLSKTLVVAILCSDAGGYISGATIDVNGGWYFSP